MTAFASRPADPTERTSPSPLPRFAGRRYRTRGWPCPRPSVFGILVVHARVDVLLQLSGYLDADGARAFAECVDAAIADHPRRIRVDCSSLDTVDAASVHCFVQAKQRANDAEVELVLDTANPEVEHVLREAAIFDQLAVRTG